jgi:hypothetical protein
MKTMKNIIYVMFCSLLFVGCDKYDFMNLERDNPLDGTNNAGNKQEAYVKFDSSSVVCDDNEDGFINSGETVYLRVNLTWEGIDLRPEVESALFSTNSQYVSKFSPTTSVHYLYAGNNKFISAYLGVPSHNGIFHNEQYTIKFTVSDKVPANTKIPIEIVISGYDASGHTKSWTDSFDVTVQ